MGNEAANYSKVWLLWRVLIWVVTRVVANLEESEDVLRERLRFGWVCEGHSMNQRWFFSEYGDFLGDGALGEGWLCAVM